MCRLGVFVCRPGAFRARAEMPYMLHAEVPYMCAHCGAIHVCANPAARARAQPAWGRVCVVPLPPDASLAPAALAEGT